MNKKLLQITTTLISFILIILPLFAFSAAAGTTIVNPLGDLTDIPTFVAKILGYAVKVGGVLSIFFFIWSGFLFVKAQGKPEELTKAKNIFIYTCIGTAILLGAQLIGSIIVGTLNSIKN